MILTFNLENIQGHLMICHTSNIKHTKNDENRWSGYCTMTIKRGSRITVTLTLTFDKLPDPLKLPKNTLHSAGNQGANFQNNPRSDIWGHCVGSSRKQTDRQTHWNQYHPHPPPPFKGGGGVIRRNSNVTATLTFDIEEIQGHMMIC